MSVVGWPRDAAASPSTAFRGFDGREVHHATGNSRRLRSRQVFTLPSEARQGPTKWYAMTLRADVALHRTKQPGLIYITGSTNGRASTQVEITVPPKGSDEEIRWEFFGLLDGVESGIIRGQRGRIDVRNYLQYAGVRAGRNVLTVDVEEVEGTSLRRADIARTRVSGGLDAPSRVTIQLDRSRVEKREGFLEVPVVLANNGGRSERDIAVTAVAAQGERRHRTTAIQIGVLRPGMKRRVAMRLPVLGSGKTEAVVQAVGATVTARQAVTVSVPKESRMSGGWIGALRTAVVLTAAAGLILLFRATPILRRRRRGH